MRSLKFVQCWIFNLPNLAEREVLNSKGRFCGWMSHLALLQWVALVFSNTDLIFNEGEPAAGHHGYDVDLPWQKEACETETKAMVCESFKRHRSLFWKGLRAPASHFRRVARKSQGCRVGGDSSPKTVFWISCKPFLSGKSTTQRSPAAPVPK